MIPASLISTLLFVSASRLVGTLTFPNTLFSMKTVDSNATNNNTVVDSSGNGLSVVSFGAAGDRGVYQSSFSPFSPNGWSVQFNGTTDCLTTSGSLTFNSLDFTVEAYVYMTKAALSSGVLSVFFDSFAGGSANRIMFYVGGSGYLSVYYGATGNSFGLSSTKKVPADAWSHAALVRKGNVLTFYIDGEPVGAYPFTMELNDTANYLMSQYDRTRTFNGVISNFRIVRGTAVYDGPFVPSKTPLQPVSGTILLLFQDSRIKNNAPTNWAVGVSAGAPRVLNVSPFEAEPYDKVKHGGSIAFNGVSGNYLSTLGLSFEGNDFTIETWLYPISQPSASAQFHIISGDYQGSGPVWGVFMSGYGGYRGLTLAYGSYGSYTCGVSTGNWLKAGAWNHIAITRQGSTIRIFVDGISQTLTVYNEGNTFNPAFNLNNVNNSRNLFNGFNGHVSGFRLVKGTAIYTSNFNTPTAPAVNTTGTQFLLLGTNFNVYDKACHFALDTVGAGVKVVNVGSKYGPSCVSFDGSSTGYLRAKFGAAIQIGTADFSVDFWFFIDTGSASVAEGRALVDCRPDGTNGYYPALILLSTGLAYYLNGAAEIAGSGGVPAKGTWHYLNLTRKAGVTSMHLNGTSIGSTSSAASNNAVSISQLLIGANAWRASAPSTYFYGKLEDVRIRMSSGIEVPPLVPTFPN